jgi:hypothetical protein
VSAFPGGSGCNIDFVMNGFVSSTVSNLLANAVVATALELYDQWSQRSEAAVPRLIDHDVAKATELIFMDLVASAESRHESPGVTEAVSGFLASGDFRNIVADAVTYRLLGEPLPTNYNQKL